MVWCTMNEVPPQPTPRPLDRRKRKSRAALRQSLLQLIAAKPYDAITIEDITEAADVARATFYAHYHDKAALLREACNELIGELTVRATALAPRDTPTYTGAAIAEVLRHADQHRDLYRLVLSGEGGATPRTELIAALRDAVANVLSGFAHRLGREPRVPMSAITTAFVGALLLTIETWLAEELEGAPADLAVLFTRSQMSGLEWALGFDHGELLLRPHRDQ
jgi:AcrR family transcriptional regulator